MFTLKVIGIFLAGLIVNVVAMGLIRPPIAVNLLVSFIFGFVWMIASIRLADR